MTIDINAIIKAGRILDAHEVPKNGAAIMNHETYIALGGTQEMWDEQSEDGLIFLELE